MHEFAFGAKRPKLLIRSNGNVQEMGTPKKSRPLGLQTSPLNPWDIFRGHFLP